MNVTLARLMGRRCFFFDPCYENGAYVNSERIDGVTEDCYVVEPGDLVGGMIASEPAIMIVVSLETTGRLVAIPLEKVHFKGEKA